MPIVDAGLGLQGVQPVSGMCSHSAPGEGCEEGASDPCLHYT